MNEVYLSLVLKQLDIPNWDQSETFWNKWHVSTIIRFKMNKNSWLFPILKSTWFWFCCVGIWNNWLDIWNNDDRVTNSAVSINWHLTTRHRIWKDLILILLSETLDMTQFNINNHRLSIWHSNKMHNWQAVSTPLTTLLHQRPDTDDSFDFARTTQFHKYFATRLDLSCIVCLFGRQSVNLRL